MMNKQEEHKLIRKCLILIEEKLGWGDAGQWHNDVFIELSETIKAETHVLLSPTTLKRVWGKIDYKSSPSISTLNTLSQFAGYINWRDFKNKVDTKQSSWIKRKFLSNIGIIVPAAGIMTLIFISFYSMIKVTNPVTIIDPSKIKFSSRPTTNDLPNSVVFDFDLNNMDSDSIYIQQFWDETKTIKLHSAQRQATGIYYFPGYFRSKLLIEGEIIKEHDLFIKSNGWVATIDYDPVPKYIDKEELFHSNLSIPKTIIEELRSSNEPLVTSFHFIKDFGKVSGDNLYITTSVRNIFKEKWAVCQNLRIVILGTEGALIIPFSSLGCVSTINLLMNDVYVNGKEHDLSAFGTDLSEFRAIVINIKNKNLSVSVDTKEIYTGNYKQSIGNFVGIRYRFLGAGEIDHLTITENNKGHMVLDTLF